MYVIIKPPNRPSYRRSVNTPDGIATAYFEMVCAGGTHAGIWPDKGEKVPPTAVLEVNTLDDLLEVLQTAHALAPDIVNAADLSGMPSFGGADVTVDEGHDIASDEQVLSWDEGRVLLVNDLASFRIVPRYGVAS
jgi:hypothetical protein